MQTSLDRQFIDFSVAKLLQYAGEIEKCLAKLSDEQVWTRSGDHQNAIGNLILHLCGNVRQRVEAIARREHVRVREAEFSADGGLSTAALRELLRATVEDAVGQMKSFTADDLSERVQAGEFNQTILECIYHMELHFALHSGQIFFITKMATGEGLGFYKPPK
jgi:hypothetical protein